jgi:hypothetical protein
VSASAIGSSSWLLNSLKLSDTTLSLLSFSSLSAARYNELK